MHYRVPEVVDRILQERTPKAVLDHMRKALQEVNVEHFCLIRFPRPDEPFEMSVVGMHMPRQLGSRTISFISPKISIQASNTVGRWCSLSFGNASAQKPLPSGGGACHSRRTNRCLVSLSLAA